MLVALLIWIYSFALFYVYGQAALLLLKSACRLEDEFTLTFPLVVLVGVATVTSLNSFVSLVMPLGGLAAAVSGLAALGLALRTQPWKNLRLPRVHVLVRILLVLTALTVLENATHRPTDFDTGLYHAQAIRWMESYRAVPGLVNLDDRLAYDSSWLVLNAALSFAFLGLRSFHLTDSVMLLACLLYLAEGFQGLAEKQMTAANVVKAILFFPPLYLYATEASSPGTDLPVILLIWVLTALLLEKAEAHALGLDLYSLAAAALGLFALTVKLSALPWCGVTLLLLIQQLKDRHWRRGAVVLGLTVAILLPWLARNFILSGYLVFPLSQIDLFRVDWKYPTDLTAATQLGLLWFNRFPSPHWKEFIGLSVAQWLPLWFQALTFSQQSLVAVALASPVSLLMPALRRAAGKPAAAHLVAFFINYLGVVYWLLSAPLLRFGYGYLLACIALAGVPVILKLTLLRAGAPRLLFAGGVGLAILFQGYLLTTTLDRASLSARIVLPADYFSSRAQPCPVRGGTVYCAQPGGLCNYAEFPCIPAPRPNVELRGATFQDGFRTVQPN